MRHKVKKNDTATSNEDVKNNTVKDDQKKITSTCLLIGFLIMIVGVMLFFGVGEEKRVERILEPFQWEGKQGFVILKFTSIEGTFTTGQTITVKPTLAYELTGKDNPNFLLSLPNSMNTTEYAKLVSLDDELTTQITDHSFTYELPLSLNYYGVFPGPLAKSFDVVWTKEGNQNGELYIIDSNPNKTKTIDLSDIITIEPQETRLQLRASEQANGLAAIVVGLTIITAIPAVLSLTKGDSDKSKLSHSNV